MMAQQTKIEWTDFTVNFWEGCQKVGPGCDHCYAEARDARFTGGKHWGPGAPRRKVKGGIAKLRKINREAEVFHAENGHWPRVFCSSLSDVFDNAVDPLWRAEAFREIALAENVQIQLLTKRVGNVEKMVPDSWFEAGWLQNVGLMITVVNQAEADRDIPKLLDLKARLGIPWVGLSMEPLLGPVDIRQWFHDEDCTGIEALSRGIACPCRGYGGPHEVTLDWVIVGGESGHQSRPMHPDWARSLRDQCQAASVAFFFKQWGEWAPADRLLPSEKDDVTYWPDGTIGAGGANDKGGAGWSLRHVGKRAAGRLLDGREWNEMPANKARGD